MPAPDAYNPLFACDDAPLSIKLITTQTMPERSFFCAAANARRDINA
jgi:hypothetical protein